MNLQLSPHVLLLDRDGVLNRNDPGYIRSPEQLEILPGVVAALRRLHLARVRVLVITNQAGVHKGLLSPSTLAAIHAKLLAVISAGGGWIDGIYHCPHRPDEGCPCRKPAPGLILQAQQEWGFDPGQTWMVGDAERDILAARAAGCLAALIRSDDDPDLAQRLPDVPVFDSLGAFVAAYLDVFQSRRQEKGAE